MSGVQARAVLILATLLLGLPACSSGGGSRKAGSGGGSAASPVTWPAPANRLELTRAAGLVPEPEEHLEHHVHAHLDVFVDGRRVTVPGGIGINTADPAVKHGTIDGQPAFGGISPPCAQPCISPLHTHDASGVLHTESSTDVDNTLGQFFVEWGVTLDANCVADYCRPGSKIAVYVNGAPFTGDARTIPLTDLKEIAIVIGRPPTQIPSTADFSKA